MFLGFLKVFTLYSVTKSGKIPSNCGENPVLWIQFPLSKYTMYTPTMTLHGALTNAKVVQNSTLLTYMYDIFFHLTWFADIGCIICIIYS